MELKSKSRILIVPEDAILNIRKIHGLEKPERLEEAISILEKWIQKQDHIIKKDFSKVYLEKTLISTKGSVEKSKKQIDSICTMRTLIPKFFTCVNIKLEMQDVLELARVTPLPKLTKDYQRVVITKISSKNVTSEILLRYFQFCVMLSEYVKKTDYANGFLVINDYRDVNIFDVMTKLNTVEIQQFVSILVEGFGARLKNIHIITESKAIELFIKTIKQFVSEKIGNRMHVHPNTEDVSRIVDKDILPKEYGGNERSVKELHEEFIEEVSSADFLEYMEMMNKACTDESRRQAAKFNEEYLGMPGSFRNLSVD